MNCRQCKNLLSENGNFAKCLLCSSGYHFTTCCPISEVSYKKIGSRGWKCPSCRNKTETAPPHKDMEEENRKRTQATTTTVNLIEKNTNYEIKEISQEIYKLSNNITLLTDSVLKLTNRVAAMENSMNTLNEKISALYEENKRKDKRIDELELKINNLEQNSLINNIEIVNGHIPHMCPKENVLELAKASGITINSSDVIDAYALKTKNKLIVKFSSLCIKKHFMKRVRESKLKYADINNKKDQQNKQCNQRDQNKNNIFINDQLTAYNKKLFWMTRNKIKINKWKFSWINEGKIFVRKDENSQYLKINNICDLENIK